MITRKEEIRLRRKNETCMIKYEEGIICIDPSLPLFHILGKKYALIILAYLGESNDGKNFNDILMGIPNSSSTIISSRLKEMTKNNIIEKFIKDGKIKYRLTLKGKLLRESIIPLLKTVESNSTLFQ